jgi:glycosyltransferase involved in cell wall biosynthesis
MGTAAIDQFSFIVPALNEEACIGACLQSIQAQADAPIEIIVVDNGCTDRTVVIARDMGCTVVGEEKLGLSFARNRGALAAHGNIVCFIDADGVLSRNWLRHARRCFANPAVGAVSGLSVYTHPNVLKRFWYNLYPALAGTSAWLANGLFGRMIFTGNNLAIRRQLFLQLGSYEPVIGEGWWLSQRFWKQSAYQGRLCLGMVLWNSPRGFEHFGFLNTLRYWSQATRSRASQSGYSYKTRQVR